MFSPVCAGKSATGSDSSDRGQGRQRLRKMIVERRSARCRDDFVILGRDQLCGGRNESSVAPGFKFVEHEPSQREETKLAGGDFEQIVVRCDENDPLEGAQTCDMNGASAAAVNRGS